MRCPGSVVGEGNARRHATAARTHVYALATCLALSACDEPREQFDGIWLGMTPTAVRDTFHPGEGQWRNEVDGAGTLHLFWTPEQAESSVKSAEFEVHGGVLVAMRAVLSSAHPAANDPSDVDDVRLRHVRQVDPDTVQVLWIAKDCPVHRDELERLESTI